MEKISLKNINLKEIEQLSREQLKNVLGGWNNETTTEEKKCPDLCIAGQPCSPREICQKIDCKINGVNVGQLACYHLPPTV